MQRSPLEAVISSERCRFILTERGGIPGWSFSSWTNNRSAATERNRPGTASYARRYGQGLNVVHCPFPARPTSRQCCSPRAQLLHDFGYWRERGAGVQSASWEIGMSVFIRMRFREVGSCSHPLGIALLTCPSSRPDRGRLSVGEDLLGSGSFAAPTGRGGIAVGPLDSRGRAHGTPLARGPGEDVEVERDGGQGGSVVTAAKAQVAG
jgi:hypothetical protein